MTGLVREEDWECWQAVCIYRLSNELAFTPSFLVLLLFFNVFIFVLFLPSLECHADCGLHGGWGAVSAAAGSCRPKTRQHRVQARVTLQRHRWESHQRQKWCVWFLKNWSPELYAHAKLVSSRTTAPCWLPFLFFTVQHSKYLCFMGRAVCVNAPTAVLCKQIYHLHISLPDRIVRHCHFIKEIY